MSQFDTTSYPFPDELFDEEGYPTEEALNYIKNWGFYYKDKLTITFLRYI